jgi:hypothetical protein
MIGSWRSQGRLRWHWRSRLLAPLLGGALGLGAGLTATPAPAQNEPPVGVEGEEKAGRSLDGYILTGCLVGLGLFIVAKSARRT